MAQFPRHAAEIERGIEGDEGFHLWLGFSGGIAFDPANIVLLLALVKLV